MDGGGDRTFTAILTKIWTGSQRSKIAFLMYFTWFVSAIEQHAFSFSVLTMVNSTVLGVNKPPETGVDIEGNSENNYDWSYLIQLAILFSFNLGCSASPFVGIIGVKYLGPRKLLFVSKATLAIVNLFMPSITQISVWLLFGFELIVGILSTTYIAGSIALWNAWFPPNERAMVLFGAFVCKYFGHVVSSSIMGVLADQTLIVGGWPLNFYFSALSGFGWCLVWIHFATNSPDKCYSLAIAERIFIQRNTEPYNLNSLSTQLSSKSTWCYVLLFAVSMSGSEYLAFVLPLYLYYKIGSATLVGVLTGVAMLCYVCVTLFFMFLQIRWLHSISQTNPKKIDVSASVVAVFTLGLLTVLSSAAVNVTVSTTLITLSTIPLSILPTVVMCRMSQFSNSISDVILLTGVSVAYLLNALLCLVSGLILQYENVHRWTIAITVFVIMIGGIQICFVALRCRINDNELYKTSVHFIVDRTNATNDAVML